jgi:hypothetical protein
VSYANNYGNHPFVPYPSAYDTENKWKLATTQPTSDYVENQQELNNNLSEQVASHTSMIEELSK